MRPNQEDKFEVDPDWVIPRSWAWCRTAAVLIRRCAGLRLPTSTPRNCGAAVIVDAGGCRLVDLRVRLGRGRHHCRSTPGERTSAPVRSSPATTAFG